MTLGDEDNMAQQWAHHGHHGTGARCWSLVVGNVTLWPGRQELYLHSDLQNIGGRWLLDNNW